MGSFVRSWAAAEGEKNPTNIQMVRTTLNAASTLVSGNPVTVMNGDQQVIFVTASGSFDFREADPAVGANQAAGPARHGTAFDFAIDPLTAKVLEAGVDDHQLDLTQLGQVTQIN